jgi:hypothetical protein
VNDSDSDSSEDGADEDALRQPSSTLQSSASTAKTASIGEDQTKTPTARSGKKEKRKSRLGEKERMAAGNDNAEKTKHRFSTSLKRLLCGRSDKKTH